MIDIRKRSRIFNFLAPLKKREIRITLNCNQNCLFCNTDINAENVILDNDNIIKQIEEWTKDGVNYLVITGREPTLHPKLTQFIKIAHELDYKKITIQTNAVRLADRDLIRELKKSGLTEAFVSFHSANEGTYNKITQSNTFGIAVKGIKNLIDEGINTTFNIVINNLNYKELPELIEYIHINFSKVKKITLSFIAPVYKALENKQTIPKITDVVPYVKKAIDKCNSFGIEPIIPLRCGFPVCFMPSYSGYFEGVKEKQFYIDKRNKIKKQDCSLCKFDKVCDGFWEDYVKVYGFK